jgi:hypothetical protein
MFRLNYKPETQHDAEANSSNLQRGCESMGKSARKYIPGVCLFIGGLAAYDEHPNNTVPNARRVHAIMSQNEQPTE